MRGPPVDDLLSRHGPDAGQRLERLDGCSAQRHRGRRTTARATPLLLPAMGRGRKSAKTRAIALGFQVVLGTLVNAILNDPGPLSLHDKEMVQRLADCLLLLLKAEME